MVNWCNGIIKYNKVNKTETIAFANGMMEETNLVDIINWIVMVTE